MKTFFLVTYLSFFTCFYGHSQIQKFKSTITDVEKPNQSDYTKYETVYHTFDFTNNLVTLEGKNLDGNSTKIVYKVKRWYKEGVTTVGVVGEKGVLEIWFSSFTNSIGYDFYDGTRLAHYEITKVN